MAPPRWDDHRVWRFALSVPTLAVLVMQWFAIIDTTFDSVVFLLFLVVLLLITASVLALLTATLVGRPVPHSAVYSATLGGLLLSWYAFNGGDAVMFAAGFTAAVLGVQSAFSLEAPARTKRRTTGG